jgi:hypothetical protein
VPKETNHIKFHGLAWTEQDILVMQVSFMCDLCSATELHAQSAILLMEVDETGALALGRRIIGLKGSDHFEMLASAYLGAL